MYVILMCSICENNVKENEKENENEIQEQATKRSRIENEQWQTQIHSDTFQ
jgi:uncharacterized Zn finger protein (UPF0148 family)